ncbi:hypothetical protein AKUA2003_PHAGE200270 (plasmid) [Apilactobacillus kunkeei]|nr:hypothetical protein AKUA1001_PHAGE200270 [Apilactobacillus kunkeei]CAI2672171.1 hypothetical protein AKUA2003_PHAGE200270 [Apilactobacillus kunkeei]CAI2803575.1 hypothetical protein AKUA2002_PHAGE200270 [Apilactobacillus kunkeei]
MRKRRKEQDNDAMDTIHCRHNSDRNHLRINRSDMYWIRSVLILKKG